MNYGEVKTYVRSLINRTDLTDALAVQFIQQAQDRLERLARPSFLQRFVSFTLDGTGGDFRVPVDFLELIDLLHRPRRTKPRGRPRMAQGLRQRRLSPRVHSDGP
jgi:hypothetical protein